MTTPCGIITVVESFDDDAVSLGSCGVSDDDIVEGESVTLEATVSNDNGPGAVVLVGFYANGSLLDTVEVDVSGGESEGVELDVVFDDPGEVDVTVAFESVSEL